MSYKKMTLATLVVTAVAMAAAVAVLWWTQKKEQQPAELEIALEFPKKKPVPEVQLTDHQGGNFTREDFIGKWSFVFFGYTHCPDICPTTLASFRNFAKTLAPEVLADTQFLLVTVDPERDTVARLNEYVPYFNEDFIGVTGPQSELTKLSLALGAVSQKVEQEQGEYLVDHSVKVFLINPAAERHALMGEGSTDSEYLTRLKSDYLKLRSSSRF